MNNHEKQRSVNDRDDVYEQSNEDSSSVICGEASADEVSGESTIRPNGNGSGFVARLTDLFADDDDLLIRDERTVMQWLQALDLQVMGACRADERLKPMLKANVSTGVAEDRLLSHLSQYFEPSEVGLLARCLCVPLVSVRVGRIDKQGTLLIPTSARGNLTLSLLPTSDLRISFIGDNGHVEHLSTLRNVSDCSSVVIEGISADTSGRSFMIKVPPCAKQFYFWCCEKSRLLGNELLEKMKNLLEKKPSLADLTGISGYRLECFLTHLRTYLVGSNTQVNNTTLVSLTGSPSTTFLGHGENGKSSQSASLASKSSRGRILSPRSRSLKEGPPRNLVSLKNVVRERFKRKGDEGTSSSLDTESVSSPRYTNISTKNQSFNAKFPESTSDSHMFPLVIGLEVYPAERTVDTPAVSSTPPVSPYYCWCPPAMSTLQYMATPLQITPMPIVESFTLPPLASLLADSTPISPSLSSSLLTPKPSLNLDEIPPVLPEAVVRLPISMPSSQQIPVFTPLMTDPIVHIPVIDICSSGQAYMVSADPAMNATIPPLHQALVSPLIQETDSVAEKGARDTLRLLISGSSQLPSVLANVDGNQNVLASGSRGLYDVNHAIANSIAAMGLISLNDKSSGFVRSRFDHSDPVNLLGETMDSGGTCSRNDDLDSGPGNTQ